MPSLVCRVVAVATFSFLYLLILVFNKYLDQDHEIEAKRTHETYSTHKT